MSALLLAACAVGSAAVHAQAPDGRAATPFAIRDVRVFDGHDVVDHANVVVRDGTIVAVGFDVAIPPDASIVDGRGRTLLPGLVDAHVHAYGDARRDALRFGVTTELDMFSDPRPLPEARRVRESVAPTAVADLWSSGILATAPHGHGTEYGFAIPTLTKPDEADAWVRDRLAEGSDYVKIILEDGSAYGQSLPTLDAATVAALVAAAHRAGRLAVAHVATEAEARTAIDAGIDGLAHVFIDRPASPEIVALAKRSGVFVVATLSVAASAAGSDGGPRLGDDARLRPWLASGQVDALRATFPAAWQKRTFLANAEESVRRLHAAGVPILAGTDAGNPGTTHGASLHGELALLVDSGLSPVEALTAATAGPADRFRLGDRGRIAAGLRADLVLVSGDPTRDIVATRAIETIWKNGVVVDRALTVDERRGVGAAPAAVDPRVSDFDGGSIAVRFGQNWMVTTDALAGGRSTATQHWIAGGADGSAGAMRVTGVVDAGLPFAWAGSLFMPGEQPFAAVDLSSRRTLVFRVRGDGRELSVMWFSGAQTQRVPATVRFTAPVAWTEVRIPLDRFAGADPGRTRGLAIVAGPMAGPFAFDVDDVRIE